MGLKECRVGTAVAVSDMDRAVEFYEGVLGLEPSEADDESRQYQCGGGTGLFLYRSDNGGTSKATLAGFASDDFDALHAELKERGVEYEHYEGEFGTDENGVAEGPGYRASWFKDPDGNIFAINS